MYCKYIYIYIYIRWETKPDHNKWEQECERGNVVKKMKAKEYDLEWPKENLFHNLLNRQCYLIKRRIRIHVTLYNMMPHLKVSSHWASKCMHTQEHIHPYGHSTTHSTTLYKYKYKQQWGDERKLWNRRNNGKNGNKSNVKLYRINRPHLPDNLWDLVTQPFSYNIHSVLDTNAIVIISKVKIFLAINVHKTQKNTHQIVCVCVCAWASGTLCRFQPILISQTIALSAQCSQVQ